MKIKDMERILLFFFLISSSFLFLLVNNNNFSEDKDNIPVKEEIKSLALSNRNIGRLNLSESGYGITYSNNIIYVATTPGIYYIDVVDPTNPTIIDFFPTKWSCYDVFAVNNIIFVSDARDMAIVDFNDLENPIEIGRVYIPNETRNVVAYGNYAYCGSSKAFSIVNISDLYNPTFLSQLNIPNVKDVIVKGNIVYITGREGIYCINVSNPRKPEIIGSSYIFGTWNMDIKDDIAYLCSYHEILIFNISDPYNPNEINKIELSERIDDIKIQDEIAYLGNVGGGIGFYNISDRLNPICIGSCKLEDNNIYEIAISKEICYASTAHVFGIECVDITNVQPSMIQGFGRLQNRGYDIVIREDKAYIADYGLSIFDIKNPLNLVKIGVYKSTTSSRSIVLNEDIAFLACGNNGLECVNISNPYDPVLVGNLTIPGYAMNLKLKDNIAYIACDISGIIVVNVSNVYNPYIIGKHNIGSVARYVEIYDNILFVLDNLNLLIFNISDPLNIDFLGNFESLGYIEYITIKDDYAFVTTNSRELYILDIKNPIDPNIVSHYNTIFLGVSIEVDGDDLYIAELADGVVHLDINDLKNPKLKGKYETSGSVIELEIKGDYLFVVFEIGIQTIKIDIPIPPGKTYLKNIQYNNLTNNIHLEWTKALNTNNYTIYRYTSPITEINEKTILVSTIKNLEFVDHISEDGTYYYVIATSNENGILLSNCQAIEIIFLGLKAPKLDPIVPFPSTNGKVYLSWNHISEAEKYLLYRSTSPITQIDNNVILLTTQLETSFIDELTTDGRFYYAIVAENAIYKSSLSNCEAIQIKITPPEENIPIEHPNIPFVNTILEPFLQYDIGMDIHVDNIGNLYVVGMVTDLNTGESDVYLLKFNIVGTLIFECIWNSGSYEFATGVALDSNGNVYVTGTTINTLGDNNIFLLKYNSKGEFIWEFIWSGDNNDEGNSVAIDSNNNIYVVGSTNSYGLISTEICLLKINPEGFIEWNITWGTDGDDKGNDIVIDNLDNIYITGTANADICVLKYSSEANHLWSMLWGGNKKDLGESIVLAHSSKCIYITGSTLSYGKGSSDIFLLKLGLEGEFKWAVTYGDEGWQEGRDIALDLFENVYIVGNIGAPPSYTGIVILKFRSSGNFVWNYIVENHDQSNIVTSIYMSSVIITDNLVGESIYVDNFGVVFVTGSSDTTDNLMLNKITYSDGDLKMGDVNGDSIVDIIDALLIAQYYVGLNPSGMKYPELADVNNDNSIDIVDSLLVASNYVS
ncbi:MAG: SBBP repeat-containing protein [Candidatus Lokiarchaeota archaeon]|nr:SBBP repeat-containing protein [Candidatus Lokiarchaeota archaeon]